MISEGNPNNPAGRLLAICRRFQGVRNEIQIRKGWAQVLGVPETDLSALLERVGNAASLVERTKRAIMSIDGIDHSLFLTWEKPVSEAFGQLNLSGGTISEIRRFFTPDVLLSLQHCDHHLARVCPEEVLKPNDVKQLLDEVKELANKVLASDLPFDLKSFISEKLAMLERCLDLYDFDGVKSIYDALDNIAGSVARRGKDDYEDMIGRDLGKEFWSLCGKLSTLVSLFKAGAFLCERIGGFLK